MADNSLTIDRNRFLALVLKSPTQMGSLSIINSVTNISRLGTFNEEIFRKKNHEAGFLVELCRFLLGVLHHTARVHRVERHDSGLLKGFPPSSTPVLRELSH